MMNRKVPTYDTFLNEGKSQNLTIPKRFANNYKHGKVVMSTKDNFLFVRFYLPEIPNGMRPKNSIWDHEKEQATKQGEFNAKLLEKYFKKIFKQVEDSSISSNNYFVELFMVSDEFINLYSKSIILNTGKK